MSNSRSLSQSQSETQSEFQTESHNPALSAELLFRPYALTGTLTLQSRLVMPAMARGFSPGGVPGPDVAAYYRRRAESGVGLIITEGAVIDHPSAVSETSVPAMYGEAALDGWAEVVRQVHEAGGRIFPQLWHMGMARPAGSQPHPEAPSIGPSGLDLSGSPAGEPMTEAQIEDVVRSYARAAAEAKRIGFDGVELQGAHGYLIDQFLWERTNKRTDRYGGDLTARARFAVDVIQAIRAETGPDFPIAIRLSQWKQSDYTARPWQTPEELGEFLNLLAEAGVDLFHCSTRRFHEPEFEGSTLNLAGWAKKLTGKPVVTVGSVGLDNEFLNAYQGRGAGSVGLDELLQRLENGEFDLVAVGRALLADPEWPRKIREGRKDELKAFDPAALGELY
ncbi:NADH:flavin oxidoreductase [Saccharibacillus sp. CPCC 101409]|uniref:NADH:flavin oxidoreductase n=1 Tax=Saccharibacillus sp. CPCC 101409 TaxID=3058041 RepID=UPI002673F0AE|nr:NADH:flavin oxidoreductase [Saccharibacillus sp. CPCC 101409]MDO3408418.1 NADH:flavin oxidoreductase [Saccharibacillus sp. CPCC 101409]